MTMSELNRLIELKDCLETATAYKKKVETLTSVTMYFDGYSGSELREDRVKQVKELLVQGAVRDLAEVADKMRALGVVVEI